MSDDNKTQKITACAFIYRDGKLFVAKRALTKTFFPGEYELPSGHIEFGETMEVGLRRELMEEFNLPINVKEPFNVFTYSDSGQTEHTIEVDYFATMVDPSQNIELKPDEHSEFCWISEEEIPKFFKEGNEEGRAAKKGFAILKKEKFEK